MKPDGIFCPEVDPRLLQEHCSRLEKRYFELFSAEQVCAHVRTLSELDAGEPVRVLLGLGEGSQVSCTILAFDHPGLFSLITGTLSALGINILSGDIFTYARRPIPEAGAGISSLQRRRIIDHFTGILDEEVPFESFRMRLNQRLRSALTLLEEGDPDSRMRARQGVNELVASRLAVLRLSPARVLFPVELKVDNSGGSRTRLTITSQDSPFFLYALSSALALRGISIESVRIRTRGERIEDEFYFLDDRGRKIEDPGILDQVRLSALLTKQFTYFLGSAPDPHTALQRFEQLAEEILKLPGQGRWLELLSNPRVLQDLARLLGASDFLWEDFIRLQYENLLPMLAPQIRSRRFSRDPAGLKAELEGTLGAATTLEQKREALNEFKDREIFLLDLDQILRAEMDFRSFSEGLTLLAELVLKAAVRITAAALQERYGRPLSVAGLETPLAILGLGKLGGGDLGYASDIEMLFVYGDSGATSGPSSISNDAYFEKLVKETVSLIQAKREGIFHVDLRLRPYGASGRLACSLERFCLYYGRGGEAHALERLALVRLRAIGGDPDFGARVERLRDEFLYEQRSLDLAELRRARLQQDQGSPRRNAKLSPGALLDLEVTVQVLQVIYGGRRPELRTPRVHEALEQLAAAEILSRTEASGLTGAYRFFRRLINALRMLRGSARDLFLPDPESDEHSHLARRMGFRPENDLSPSQRLHHEFETHTAVIRTFVERHLGRDSLPDPGSGNLADLVLSEQLPIPVRHRILAESGFRHPARAYINFKALGGDGERRDSFARLAILARDYLRRLPDPDMALNNWERFLQGLDDPAAHFRRLLAQPRLLDILLILFSGSQFLADTLIRNPEFLEWAVEPERLHLRRDRSEVEALLRESSAGCPGQEAWLNRLRLLKRRELLRIGIRDICLAVPLAEVVEELSILAESVIRAALFRNLEEEDQGLCRQRFCVLAFGKLGGRELNYSSDVDLLGVVDDDEASGRESCRRLMRRLHQDLSRHTEEGYAYRVDLRLRPHGRSGELVPTVKGLEAYYKEEASFWELQALLKARPVAGDLAVGEAFLERVRPLFLVPRSRIEVVASIQAMRQKALAELSANHPAGINIKSSRGGIRDVEFLAQGLQILFARQYPQLLTGNTLKALAALKACGILPAQAADELRLDYLFLRRIEHHLQFYEDLQTHVLPQETEQLTALARRILGMEADSRQFLDLVASCLQRVSFRFQEFLS